MKDNIKNLAIRLSANPFIERPAMFFLGAKASRTFWEMRENARAFFPFALEKALSRSCQQTEPDNEPQLALCANCRLPFVSAFNHMVFKRMEELKKDEEPAWAFLWGMSPSDSNMKMLAIALEKGFPIALCEDGFLRSADTAVNSKAPERFRASCSLVLDRHGFHFDANLKTDIETLLESAEYSLAADDLAKARKMIDRIVDQKITKYNHQPILQPQIGRQGAPKILVVDQSYRDYSIRRGWANDSTFAKMLSDAIADNPDADILVKTHPDAMTGQRTGYYDHVQSEGRIVRVTMPVNPYSLLEIVEKVYVCSTQLGFEALMAGKEVHVYGMPFYAGWGLTNDAQRNPRRTRKRTIEEVFHAFYVQYTRYFNPETGAPWSIEQALDHLVELRSEYDQFRNRNR